MRTACNTVYYIVQAVLYNYILLYIFILFILLL